MSGVKNYGYLIYAAGVLVFVAAAIVIAAGFAATPASAIAKISAAAGIHVVPRPSHPSVAAFISVIGLLMFAYGGLDASTSLAGEVTDARRNMPRGIVAGWAIALVLYTLSNGFNVLNLGANYQGLIEGTVLIGAAAIYTIGGRHGGRIRPRRPGTDLPALRTRQSSL